MDGFDFYFILKLLLYYLNKIDNISIINYLF